MTEHVQDRLTALVHGELPPVEARAVEEHLGSCAECRRELAEIEQADALAAGLTLVEAPRQLWQDIERGIDAAQRRNPRRKRRLLGFVALFLLAAMTVLWVNRRGPEPPGPALDMATFLSTLETAPRQPDGREFGLVPDGFESTDETAAAVAAGLGSSDGTVRLPGSELFAARVLRREGHDIHELILGNDDGPYALFVAPGAIEPDFGERAMEHVLEVSPTCARVASAGLSVFWDAGATSQWILVGRDHTESFYKEVLRAVAAAQRTPEESAFDWIRELKGTWEGTYEWSGKLSGGGPIRMDYTPTGLGSAMVETHLTQGRASMSSVYHMDGDRLVMTHFCIQNQPRLAASTIDLEQRTVRFDFVDITDHVPSEGHVNGVELFLSNDNEIRLLYHYIAGNDRSVETIHLKRRRVES